MLRERGPDHGLPLDVTARLLTVLVAVLTAVGVLTLHSASQIFAMEKFGDPAYFVRRQMVGVALGALAFFACSRVPYRLWGRYARPLFLITVLLLVATLVLGSRYNGARRWIRFFGVGIQPSEIAKLAVVVHAAAFLAAGGEAIRSYRHGFLPAFFPVGILAVLVLVEPDFGTAMFLGGLALVLFIAGGVRGRHVFLTTGSLLPAVFLFMFTFFDHVRERIQGFTGGELPYQVKQGFVALGSGGLFGKGIGAGSGKLLYIPEVTGDFIFPAFGEETGFVGVLFVILLFAGFLLLGMRIARGILPRDRFGYFLALGITWWIPFQACLNLAVVSGSVPPKGIALPFISYGSSGLVITLAVSGILVNIARTAHATRLAEPAGGAT